VRSGEMLAASGALGGAVTAGSVEPYCLASSGLLAVSSGVVLPNDGTGTCRELWIKFILKFYHIKARILWCAPRA
jgi:hypothetical protein